MDEIWSRKIQGIINLDSSREFRFRDDRKELFLSLLGLKDGMVIADIGCGPGTITRKLAQWLSKDTRVIGIDRDRHFIQFAKRKAEEMEMANLQYLLGDGLDLPLEDDSVDASLSHTVIEHVPHREFLLEQKRICKKGGRVSVMYTLPKLKLQSSPEKEIHPTEEEKEGLSRLFNKEDHILEEYKVGKYWPDSAKLPALFHELGFQDIQIDAVAMPFVIDDSRYSLEEKIAMAQVEGNSLLENIEMAIQSGNDQLDASEVKELKRRIRERMDQRIQRIRREEFIWDYRISVMEIVSGRV